jgi:uncharacterized protein YybS (DUF2232 family)
VTRKVAIGMIRAALMAAALFLAGGAVPALGGIAMLFAPAPILIFAAGRPNALARIAIPIAVAAILVTIAAGWLAGVSYLATLGLATAIMGAMLERQSPFELIVVMAGGAMLFAALVIALVATGGPAALVNAMQAELVSGLTRGQELYRTLGLPNAVPPETQSEILDLTLRLSPALAALLAASTVLLNLRLFWRWVGKQRLPYVLFGDLVRWSAPEWLVWGLIATGFGLLAPWRPLSDVALNGFIFVAAVYFCQGLAIMAFYFQMLAVPSIVRGIIYFIAIVQPVVAGVVCLAGVFDMWIDFRRLKPPSQEAGNYGDFL